MRSVVAVVAALGLSSCERVVDLDLREGEKQLVVEARIEAYTDRVTGFQRFRLSTTDDFFSTKTAPPATGATIEVTDGDGRFYPLVELSGQPGTYITQSLVAQVGQRYHLKIEWQGERYEATDLLPAVAPIARLYFRPRSGFLGPSEGLRATIDFEDPKKQRDFYVWDQFVNGTRIAYPDSSFRFRVIARDDVIDGLEVVGFQPYDGVVVRPGDRVAIKQMSLSESAYQYYFALSDQSTNSGSPFAVPPSSVRSNIANVTRPGHRALGYFMTSAVSVREGVVTDR